MIALVGVSFKVGDTSMETAVVVTSLPFGAVEVIVLTTGRAGLEVCSRVDWITVEVTLGTKDGNPPQAVMN